LLVVGVSPTEGMLPQGMLPQGTLTTEGAAVNGGAAMPHSCRNFEAC